VEIKRIEESWERKDSRSGSTPKMKTQREREREREREWSLIPSFSFLFIPPLLPSFLFLSFLFIRAVALMSYPTRENILVRGGGGEPSKGLNSSIVMSSNTVSKYYGRSRRGGRE
jgi:hypothetical protein